MKTLAGLLLTMSGLVLATSLAVATAAALQARHGSVVTLAHLQAGLAEQPQDWLSRTLRVSGIAEPCPWWGGTARLWQCAGDALILVAGPADPVATPLPLSRQPRDTILGLLRGLPLLSALAAPDSTVPLQTPLHFLVRLRLLGAQACGGRVPCYEAVLLNVSL